LASASGPEPFHVNPTSIRVQVIEKSTALDQAFMRVLDAKDKLNQSRLGLLPSLNLSGLLNIGNTPGFLLSSVQFLLPFMLPSNWFNMGEESNQFEAEKISFQIVELNTYASALSVYFTALSDQKNARIHDGEATDYEELQAALESQDRILHNVPAEQLANTRAKAMLLRSQADGLKRLAADEEATLRSLLSLSIQVPLILDDAVFPPLPIEDQDLQALLAQALKLAPELQQIQRLISAAIYAKRSTIFSFLGGSTLGSQVSPNSSSGATTAGTRSGGSLNIGAGIFPALALEARSLEKIKLQADAIQEELVRVLESATRGLPALKNQTELAIRAEAELMAAYEAKRIQYQLEAAPLSDVLTAHAQVAAASAARAQAELNLNLLRTTLQRTLLGGEFSGIMGCKLVRNNRKQTLFEACRSASAN
jgi:outer membrane protein TolC